MVGLQAAVLLASRDHEGARARLREALESESALDRRTAARALAQRAGEPDAVRALLEDDDPMVRIYAAGGILAAAHD
jgi:HEAT repeat protein